MKITRKWCFILYHLYFPLKVQVITIKENLAFKGRRPHLRTIDDTSLPQGIRDPNISFADFSESARWWSPWSALIGWALLHQTHQNLTKLRSNKSIDQSVIFVNRQTVSVYRVWRASFDNRHYILRCRWSPVSPTRSIFKVRIWPWFIHF